MLGFGGVYNRMKKLIILLIIFLLFSINALFAATIDPYRVQTISGFIDNILYLYVSPFLYEGIVSNGYAGVNLDHQDTNNDIRYLIAPTNRALSEPGLVIGQFSVLATYKDISLSALNLVITHTKLVHTNDSSIKLDYELAVLYTLNDGSSTQNSNYIDIKRYCYSEDSDSSTKSITIDLKQSSDVTSIQNANIYFRLKNGDTPSVTGQYVSTIKFSLETT